MRGNFFIGMGILGALLKVYGHTQPFPQPWYVAGALLLLITAIEFKLLFFIGLETILLMGHFSIMLDMHQRIQIALPILLSLQLSLYYLFVGRLKNPFLCLGLIGIVLISVSFNYHRQWILFSGCILLGIYAFYRSLGEQKVALIWALLNLSFAIMAAQKILL